MRVTDFDFDLPEHLIATFPASQRTGSRLLVPGKTGCEHRQFRDLKAYLEPGDLLVFNDTRVIPARLFGRKATGGQLEILIERITGEACALAHVRASRSPRPGSEIVLENEACVRVLGRQGALFELAFDQPVLELLERVGHVPLPPYIARADQHTDKERYQTVYAEKPGAVAAPTAGLHFDEAYLALLREYGVELGFVTLHVGAGTFQPVKVDDVADHTMHSEWFSVSPELVEQVHQARVRGRRVIAVGTTSLRALESASEPGGTLRAGDAETDIFIYPGYQFRQVDALVTNFHLPKSTLMMLVSAFAGYGRIMSAYREAVTQEYRFFSYGDSMFLLREEAYDTLEPHYMESHS